MKRKRKALLLCSAMVMTAFALTGCGKKKINLNDYVKVDFSGYNTVGIAEINNLEAVQNVVADNWELFGLTEKDRESESYYSNPNAYQFLDNVSVSLDNAAGLSNGDTVTVQWKVYEDSLTEVEKELKADFTYSDMEITVEGLEDAVEWDAFEKMEYSFGGLSTQGYVSFEKIEEVPDLHYSTEIEIGGLSNGDALKVILQAPDNQDVTEYCMTYGKIPTALSTEVTVEGLDGYLSDLSNLPTEMKQKMDGEIQSKIAADAAKAWDDTWKIAEIELLGNYLLNTKTNSSPQNYLYYIYKITATNESTGETVPYYTYGVYQDVMLLGDGTLSVDLLNVTLPSGRVDFKNIVGEAFYHGDYFFVGYEDLETLFHKKVTGNGDKYTYTSTVNQ